MTTILQLTDTHIVREGALVSGRLETAGALTRLVDRIMSIKHQIWPIDAVLVSGDLSDDGSAESYVRFQSMLAPLGMPIYVIPGNHDAREPMRAAFSEQLPVTGPLNWSRTVGDVLLIGLDSLVEGHGHGTLDSETLKFLSEALENADGAAVLLALHHPPFQSGIGFMDDIGLTNRVAFREVIAQYSSELRVVCGHIHSLVIASISGHIALSAPSPCSTFESDYRADAQVGYRDMEDGCLLHRYDGSFQSVRIGPVAGAGPFPF